MAGRSVAVASLGVVILLYDSGCGFCCWAVGWVLARDPERSIEPVAIDSDRGAELLADLTPERRLSSVRVVLAGGSRYAGGAAVRVLLDALPRASWLARVARAWPAVTDAAYTFVAAHRGRFSRLVSRSAMQRAQARLAGSRCG